MVLQGKILFVNSHGHFSAEQYVTVSTWKFLLCFYAFSFFAWIALVATVPKAVTFGHFSIFPIILLSLLCSFLEYSQRISFNHYGEVPIALTIFCMALGVARYMLTSIMGMMVTNGQKGEEKIAGWGDRETITASLYAVTGLSLGAVQIVQLPMYVCVTL